MRKNWELLCGGVLLLAAVAMYFCGLVEVRVAAVCVAAFGVGMAALWLLRRKKLERWHGLLAGLLAGGVCLVCIGMGVIDGAGTNDWQSARQADYAVVLGCKVNGQTPSRTLRERLDLTLRLMEENPGLTVIVSGGKGDDENVAEGEAMAAYLRRQGADMTRVIAETQARTTRENLQNSVALMEPGAKIVVVTSDFHVSRARWIAGTLGIETAGVGSRTTPMVVRWCDLLREVFAYGKAFVVAAVS